MYQVIFTGVREGVARPEAIKNLAALFKTTPEQVEKLLASSGHILKKGITAEVAGKYRAAIEAAGGACRVEQELAPVQTLDVDLPRSLATQGKVSPTIANPDIVGTQRFAFKIKKWMYAAFGVVFVGVLMLFIIGLEQTAPAGPDSMGNNWNPPMSGTWQCDNVSRNRAWQIWKFSPDGNLFLEGVEGIVKLSGQYIWEGGSKLHTTFADDPKLNQIWYIAQGGTDNWLMSNGRFEVICHK